MKKKEAPYAPVPLWGLYGGSLSSTQNWTTLLTCPSKLRLSIYVLDERPAILHAEGHSAENHEARLAHVGQVEVAVRGEVGEVSVERVARL